MSKNLLFPQAEHFPNESAASQSSGRQVFTTPEEVRLNRQSVHETVPVGVKESIASEHASHPSIQSEHSSPRYPY